MSHLQSSPSAVSVEFLQKCFVIFDASIGGEESAKDEDEVLFFYPPGVPAPSKSHFNGWCSAMIAFTKNFTNHPLEVATLEKFKVAFKQIGSITMVLTGAAEQPDSTILNHLDLIYSAFRFYNRSFTAIMESNTSKKELLQKMGQIGRELVPLITHNFHKNVLRSFNPIPYTPLPHKANRHFIQASQLLNFIKMEPGNLSGCVIYKNSVVCTHLDFTTTRWILNRIEYNKSSLNFTSQPSYSNLPTRGRIDPVCDFIPVYMFRDAVERLKGERENMFPFTNIQNTTIPLATSPFSPPPMFRHAMSMEEDEEDIDGFISLGLCIVSVNELSIAIIMTFKAFSNKQHINKSIWKIPSDPQFQALESDLENDNATANSNPAPPTGAASPPTPTRAVQQQQQLLYNARIVQANNYNFLAYDSLTQSATTTPLQTPQEYEFASSSSLIHHAFLQDPSISQIIRKDNTGEIFGKQVFGREVFYQLKNSANMSHDKFLEVIEKTVRSTLKDDHNINMI